MKVAPSLLSADFANLERDVRMVNRSEASLLHLDVMDGVFVPNISFGFPVIESIKNISEKPLDVHLMIVEPQKFVSQVRDCGAEYMNVHYETCQHLHRTVQQIRSAGMKAAVTLNPDIVAVLDMVLLMSVNPGFGGQTFIEQTLDKTRRLRNLIMEAGAKALIEIDGGVNLSTGKSLAEAGADILVAGSFVFSSADPILTIKQLSNL